MSTAPSSPLFGSNAWFAEELYERYLQDPSSVAQEWRRLFESLPVPPTGEGHEVAHTPVREAYTNLRRRSMAPSSGPSEREVRQQVAVLQLINAYRFRGHRRADLDPLRQHERPAVPELEPAYHGLDESAMEQVFNTGSLAGVEDLPLREILDILRTTYCRTIGAEYMHINKTIRKRWIQDRLEPGRGIPSFSTEEKLHILERLVAANTLESYLHTKYVGQKRFSLEGGESLIPLLDQLIDSASLHPTEEVVIGMAHRGRLNVLVNIIGKCPGQLFEEFEGKNSLSGSGDVKYHMGYSSDVQLSGGPVHLTLAFNPSHLEIIDPVVEGSVRARQDRRGPMRRDEILPILIHGDAAFAGQGVVMETLNLSETRGFGTGGTVHIVINNQIGFTTSDPLDSRSTLYCTDVANMIQAPIFHVNGDDPEAVVMIARLALEYRMTFHKDVVIDLVCYRRHGHSEADEPFTTQPLMYKKISAHPPVHEIYGERLVREGVIGAEELNRLREEYIDRLDRNEPVSRPQICATDHRFRIDFSPYLGTGWREPGDTRIDRETFDRLAARITDIPEGFVLSRSVQRILQDRRKMGSGEIPMDWGFAETMAYASLVDAGHPVRLSGQDCGRGTFFHRHAELHNQEDDSIYVPLQHIREGQADFTVINSILSEEAVLGFEYGYSSAAPEALVIWEAQFGDFANGAQVVIDQFISSAVSKWNRHCGLVLLLPHGYDGQGPEHSSARLERYLQLCAEENMQVCFPSTPAQMFHLLRRQVIRPYRRPVAVMSPKSMLRHPLSVSTIEDLTGRGFEPVFDEVDDLDREQVRRVLMCSGKVYYDLLEARREREIGDIAILRLEQLYPFPKPEIEELLASYPAAREVVWVQEEPRNMGSWVYLLARNHLYGCLRKGQRLSLVARPYSASPAVGYLKLHLQQQKTLVEEALQSTEQFGETHEQAERKQLA